MSEWWNEHTNYAANGEPENMSYYSPTLPGGKDVEIDTPWIRIWDLHAWRLQCVNDSFNSVRGLEPIARPRLLADFNAGGRPRTIFPTHFVFFCFVQGKRSNNYRSTNFFIPQYWSTSVYPAKGPPGSRTTKLDSGAQKRLIRSPI